MRTVVKGVFLSLEIILTGVLDEKTDILEAATITGKSHVSPGTVEWFIFSRVIKSHQCMESVACVFQSNVNLCHW